MTSKRSFEKDIARFLHVSRAIYFHLSKMAAFSSRNKSNCIMWAYVLMNQDSPHVVYRIYSRAFRWTDLILFVDNQPQVEADLGTKAFSGSDTKF